MNKKALFNNYQARNDKDRFLQVYRYLNSIDQKGDSPFQELVDYTVKNNGFNMKKNKKA